MALLEGENGKVPGRTWKEKAFLFLSLLLVGALCFEAGLLSKLGQGEVPLAIHVVESTPPAPQSTETAKEVSTPASALPAVKNESAPLEPATCPFVGSKNSDKYHIPSCSYAKRILPANRICFASEEEAQKKGYTAGCLK